MKQEQYDVVVIGAGVVGCAVAYHLAKTDVSVALLDKGRVAGEASQAGAGMLAPLDEEGADPRHPLQQFYLRALAYYTNLDQQLKQETGIDIELVDAPTLRLAFDEHEATTLQSLQATYQEFLPGLQWLDGKTARAREPLLSESVHGALISPTERNVQVSRLTLALARGAAFRGTRIFEGRPLQRLLRAGQRLVGVETAQGPITTEQVVLAAGAWASRWHSPRPTPPIFPVKGQILALQAPVDLFLRHTVHALGVGGIVPKADGRIYVGATIEEVGFEKEVTLEGLATLRAVVERLTPALKHARLDRAWAGLRPGSADHEPLIGASKQLLGLWIAGGHERNGILLGPLTGHILAELIQGHVPPLGLDLAACDPDRFGGWDLP
jgi:glycine oxidase